MPPSHTPHATPGTYSGLFLVTLATLLYEILLTRIFSVSMWYHFAFVAISVAMFGMTVGAIIVYLRPAKFPPEWTPAQLATSSLLFAIGVILSFLTHLIVPFDPDISVIGAYTVAFTYTVIAIPFVFSGVAVCLALTRYPADVNRLYAADLIGAAVGCIAFIYALKVTDGPGAVTVVAAIAALGGWCFAIAAGRRARRFAATIAAVLVLAATVQAVLVQRQAPLISLRYVKGVVEQPPLYEKWNSFSRIRVSGDPRMPLPPFGWGMSPTVPKGPGIRQLILNIDAAASTVLTAFDGRLESVDHLRYDVTNIVHYLRPYSHVLVVGTGGGRDILSALAFRQPLVTGVEINQDIIRAVNGTFGDFTGHLDSRPGVRFVNDEARSYIARLSEPVAIIQISLIDTWAATAAGAYVLSENSLYTVEAWKLFLRHLTPRGVLTVSRWYFANRPGEVYRMTALASQALKEIGVANPRLHIVIVRSMGAASEPAAWNGVGTMLVSPSPFDEADLATVSRVVGDLQFETMLTPHVVADPFFAELASAKDVAAVTAGYPLDVSPPRDDKPFFFQMLRLRDAFRSELWNQGVITFNLKAVFIVLTLLAVVVVLTLACIGVPLLLTADRTSLRGASPLMVYFAAIGFGFMLVEISQLQRLVVFLGHPTYSLSVVLFSLLLSGGLGSYATSWASKAKPSRAALVCLVLLLVVLVVFGSFTPAAIAAFEGASTPIRVGVAVAVLCPLGFFMGMTFPIGMRLATARSEHLTPWLWGINGATSVCSSVLAIVIALHAGVSASFWVGFACYCAALLAFRRATSRLAYAPSAHVTVEAAKTP